MREVAKSMLGFSWAVSLFGVQQMSKVMTASPVQSAEAAAAEVDDVSRAVQSHLSGAAATRFQAGDQWARQVIDTLFDAATGQSFDPRRMVESLDPRHMMDVDPRKLAEAGVATFHQSVDAVKQAVKSVSI